MPLKVVKVGEALKFGWQTFKTYLWFLLGVTLIQFFLPRLIGSFGKTEDNLVSFLVTVLAAGLSLLMSIGSIKISLALVDGVKPPLADLFRHYAYLINYFLVSLLYGVIVAVGLILLIIPGIYFALKYQFAMYLVVDKNMGVFEALKRSGEITAGVKWPLFQFIVVQAFLNLIGFLLLGLGLLVTIPVTMLAYSKIFRILESGLTPAPVVPIPTPPISTPGVESGQ